jgi:hypothetical protein
VVLGRVKLHSNSLKNVRFMLRPIGTLHLCDKFAFLQLKVFISRFSEIFFVDASTIQTITTDLRSIAIDKGIEDSEKDWKDALDWLSRNHKEWLLLFNNADDTRINLRNYFPICSHGNILITSRNHEICQHATGRRSNYKVSGMADPDARCLLLDIAGLSDDEHADETERLATTIVKVCYETFV